MKTLNHIQNNPNSASGTRVGLAKVAVVLGLAIAPIALVAMVSAWKNIPLRNLTADPVAILNARFYFGFLSQLGIFMWAAMIAICFLMARVLPLHAKNYPIRRFFLWSGLFILLLSLDDVFLLHESVFPAYLGMPEVVTYTLYAGLAAAYLWHFRKVILRSDYTFLALCLTSFGLSLGLDILPSPYIVAHLFEEGLKFIGLVAWLAYFWQFSVSCLRSDYGLVYPVKEGASLLTTTRQ